MKIDNGIKVRKRYRRFITEEELRRFLNTLKKEESVFYQILFSLMTYLGLRSCEAVAVNIMDFDKEFKQIKVRLAKSNEIKIRDVPEFLAKEIKEYCKKNYHHFKQGYLFTSYNPASTSKNHFHIDYNAVEKILNRLRKKLRLTDYYMESKNGKKFYRIGTHSFRRFFITSIYNKTKDIVITKDIIGHKNINTTLSYIDPQQLGIEDEIVNECFNRFNNIKEISKEQMTLNNF